MTTVRAAARPAAFVLGMREMGLAVARALGREGIRVFGFEIASPRRPRAPGFSSRYFVARHCPDPRSEPEALLRLLASYAERHASQPVLFFTDDLWIDFVVRHRDALARSFRFALPPPLVADALLDKRKQMALAWRGGLACPATYFPETRDDVEAIRHSIEYPAFIKPCFSHVWRERFRGDVKKGFRVDSPEELIERFDQVLATGLPVIVQSVVLGLTRNHLKFCAYIGRDWTPLATYTGRKLRQYPVQFGVGTLCESAAIPEVAELGLRFLAKVGYRGYASIELKRDDRDGQIKFIELNGRPVLHQALMVDAGVNFPLVEYLDVTGLPQRPIAAQRCGLKWWLAAEDVKSFLSLRRSRRMSFVEWVRSWAGARSFGVFALDDPLPVIRWYSARIAWSLARRVRQTRDRRRAAIRTAAPSAPAAARSSRGIPRHGAGPGG
jgi:D-aspartate ligase